MIARMKIRASKPGATGSPRGLRSSKRVCGNDHVLGCVKDAHDKVPMNHNCSLRKLQPQPQPTNPPSLFRNPSTPLASSCYCFLHSLRDYG